MKKFIFLSFMVLSLAAFSQEKDEYTILTLYNGLPFRPSAFGYSSELSLEKFTSQGYREKDQGISLNYEYIGNHSYTTGIKYYRTLFENFPILYIAIQPDYYEADNHVGFNLRPELGLQYDPIWQYVVGLRFRLAYGYDIPISNTEGLFYNRNVIELKVGITFNLHHGTSY